MICISIGNKEQISQVNELKPSLVEMRYDLLKAWPVDCAAIINKDIKQVATCRPGVFSETERRSLLLQAVDLGASYIDIELESASELISDISAATKEKQANLILSYHNFEGTPDQEYLSQILFQAYEKGADLAKIACMVNHKEDNARLLSLYAYAGRKLVLGMGELGKITRLTAVLMGAEFTFASLTGNDATAPGQVTYKELQSFTSYLQRL